MKTIKTSELTGAALDWAVSKCEGIDTRTNACVWFLPFESESDDPLAFLCCADDEDHAREQCENAYPDCTVDSVEHIGPHNYSTDWSKGGPIIEREGIELLCESPGFRWVAVPQKGPEWRGNSPLVAAMRCFVGSTLGHEITIPEEFQ